MEEYKDIAKNSAELLKENFEKEFNESKDKGETLFKAFVDFQEINNIKYPYKHMQVELIVNLVEEITDKKPIENEVYSLPPVIAQDQMKTGEIVHISPKLDQNNGSAGPARVVSIENYLYSHVMKTIVMAVVFVGNKEAYEKYKKGLLEIGGMTKEDAIKEYLKTRNEDASATPDKSPSVGSKLEP